jgi:alkylated DNA repair dioxygenase AlkB
MPFRDNLRYPAAPEPARPNEADPSTHGAERHALSGPLDAEPPNLLPRDGRLVLYEAALERAQAANVMERLRAEVAFGQPELRIMGRLVSVPRLVAWFGDATYGYSGIVHAPLPFTPALEGLRWLASDIAGVAFNSVLLNLYRDGRDSMGWHSDDEPELGADPVIASLSLGAVRRFRLRHKRNKALTVALDVPHGSLLLMAGPTQHHWLHALPKTARPVGPRLNLTFRYLRPGGTPARTPLQSPP